MPKSVPLRAMVATTVEPATSRHGSAEALPAAMARFRKNWSLPAMNSATRASAAAGPPRLDEEDGHGGRDHAGHGACRPRRVAWRDLHLAFAEEVEGFGVVGRPSLVTDGAEDGRLHGLAGRLPAERRSRVEHRAAGEPHHRAGGPAVDQDRLRPGH